jgi:hypothetical protein
VRAWEKAIYGAASTGRIISEVLYRRSGKIVLGANEQGENV